MFDIWEEKGETLVEVGEMRMGINYFIGYL